MNEGKKMSGFTYIQLHSLSTEELTNILTSEITRKVREMASNDPLFQDQEELEKFLSVYAQRLIERVSPLLDDAFWKDCRALYDTEERFNLTIATTERMGDIGQLTHGLMTDVVHTLIQDSNIT